MKLNNKTNKQIRVMALLIIMCLIVILQSGCYDNREIDELGYAVALGLDKGKDNLIKLTLQIAVPAAIGGGESGGGGSQTTTLTTVEAPSIYAALQLVNSYVSKQVNLSHAKLYVLSEELAKENITNFILGATRIREFRPDMDVIIARGTAEDFLKGVQPKFEINPAKYYEMVMSSFRYTGFITRTPISSFTLDNKITTKQPVAVIGASSKYKNSSEFSNVESTFRTKDRESPLERDYIAGSIPRTSELKSEVMGLAVFKNLQYVGTLDGENTIIYNMLTDNFNHASMSFPDIKFSDKVNTLNIKKSRTPELNVSLENGTPKIKIKLTLEADIISLQTKENYDAVDKIPTLEKATSDYIEKHVIQFLDIIVKQYNSDIVGFGDVLKMKYLTLESWKKVNWFKIFKSSKYEVNVDLKIRRTGLVVKNDPDTSDENADIK